MSGYAELELISIHVHARYISYLVFSFICFMLCLSLISTDALPVEASSLPPDYKQKGLLCPDGNWLSKRARLNQAGLVAVASPVAQQKFDGLTGSW